MHIISGISYLIHSLLISIQKVLILQEMSLLRLPVDVEIKCKAMMGICIYWISRHLIFGKSSFLTRNAVGNILQSLCAMMALIRNTSSDIFVKNVVIG